MTQEERLLLLKCLVDNLMHGLVGKSYNKEGKEINIFLSGITRTSSKDCWRAYLTGFEHNVTWSYDRRIELDNFVPYLRPLSTMTEDEQQEFEIIGAHKPEINSALEWFNSHHFDWQGLIEKGLAISTEEYNPY